MNRETHNMSKPSTSKKPASPKYNWPVKTEKRSLLVDLKPEELANASRDLAETVPHIASLESAAKASAAQHKSGIQAAECEQRRLSYIVSSKREERLVDCEWLYETSGIDSQTKKPIYHPEKKTLIRTDTGAVVAVLDIQNDERQLSLLPEGDDGKKNEKDGGEAEKDEESAQEPPSGNNDE
jgi:hypothetical protein